MDFTCRGTWRKGSTNAIVLRLEASCPEMVLALAVIRKGALRRKPSEGMLQSKGMGLLPARNKTWRRLRLMRLSKTVSKAKVAMVDMNEVGPGGDAGGRTSWTRSERGTRRSNGDGHRRWARCWCRACGSPATRCAEAALLPSAGASRRRRPAEEGVAGGAIGAAQREMRAPWQGDEEVRDARARCAELRWLWSPPG